ncbi:lipoprotein N-acyltransferase Lnb domain-containing protein [Siansivirga zeaxanthinifaciens]|uniref:Membrane protein n=1 Tax=Siansivirga zeaxanthinifaciens CC-SAMT-1 TaxID=1454006 RepID=A0A0C5W9J8_9FLAO|nr:DUF4105 domain-containing protein [Siansivirga zeaxanthinifaciens]AJR03798.1 membrane protein [Siansivirga zeaxanthinifaciens CC-SAMT-1]
MKKTVFLFVFLLIASWADAQINSLSEKAEISVLTIGPGNSLNDAFGHSAFRVKDYIKGTDLVFNYGVYDFNTPNFYTKFAQGKLNYLIGVNYYSDFYESYIAQNRSIQEQVLNLSSEEKQKLFNYLADNMKPENRAYLYDFFYDNCATKIKDITQQVLNNKVVFHTPSTLEPATFRTLIQENLNRNSWGSLGIDIALGSVIDRVATPKEFMFLPKNIHAFFNEATILPANKPLVSSDKTLFSKRPVVEPAGFITSPLVVFTLLAILIIWITYNDYKKASRSKWLDEILFAITGLIGIFILLLWFATDHKGTHQNYNLLWAFALNIFVINQLFKKHVSLWFIKYLKLLIILLCLLTLHWIVGVQVFAITLIPLLIALFLRYVFLVKHFSKA